MIDVMVDLETMGVGNNPALTQISAAMFDINTGKIGKTFNVCIDLQSSMDAGLSISAGTIKFWMTNPSVTQKARDIVMSETGNHNKKGGRSLEGALSYFEEWLKINNAEYIHGNGAASDNVWLRSAYSACNLQEPLAVNFRSDICFRSLKTLAKRRGWVDNVVREGVYHNGLDDAIHQVKVFRSVLSFLGLSSGFDEVK